MCARMALPKAVNTVARRLATLTCIVHLHAMLTNSDESTDHGDAHHNERSRERPLR